MKPLVVLIKLPFIITLSLMPLLIQGCTLSQTQLVRIANSEQISLGALVTAPDEIRIEYIGFTVFANRRIDYPTRGSTPDVIRRVLSEQLVGSDLIDYVELSPQVTGPLHEVIEKSPFDGLRNGLSDDEVAYLAEWGVEKGLDYIALLRPYAISSPFYGPSHPKGKGVLVDGAGAYLHAIYRVELIDTSTSEVVDIARLGTFKQVPRFAKQLSPEDVKRVTRDWQYGKDQDLLEKDPERALEEMMIHASFFVGNDYASMGDDQLRAIDQDLNPVIERNITLLLTELGFLAGERPGKLIDVVRSEEDLTYKTYRFD